MSKYCIACKKLYIPGDRSSSFHCFPKDVEQRKKWMQIIGISTCPQNTRVCSDHFESSCYHPNDDYQTDVRKLRSNAIPSLKRKILSDITNVQASPDKKHCNYNHVTIQSNENVQQHNFLVQLSVDKELSNKTLESNTENNNLQIFNELSEHSPQSNLDYNSHAITSSLFIENSSLKRKIDSKESFHFPNKKLCSIDKQDDSTVNSNLLERIVVTNTEVPNAIKSTSNVLKRKITVDTVQGHVTKKLCLTNNENSQAAVEKNITHKIKNKSSLQNVQNIRIIKRKPWNKSNSSNVLKLKTTFQWKDGKAVKHFTRQDFASDKAWNEFLKFTVVNY